MKTPWYRSASTWLALSTLSLGMLLLLTPGSVFKVQRRLLGFKLWVRSSPSLWPYGFRRTTGECKSVMRLPRRMWASPSCYWKHA
jgi:hypothetical protein